MEGAGVLASGLCLFALRWLCSSRDLGGLIAWSFSRGSLSLRRLKLSFQCVILKCVIVIGHLRAEVQTHHWQARSPLFSSIAAGSC